MLKFLRAWFTHLKCREVFQLFCVNRVHGLEGPIMTQVNLIGLLGFAVRIHIFFRGDGDEFHSHPRGFVSVGLFGSYKERLYPDGERIVRPGVITVRRADEAHNVTPLKFPCVTLALVAPVTRKWEKIMVS